MQIRHVAILGSLVLLGCLDADPAAPASRSGASVSAANTASAAPSIEQPPDPPPARPGAVVVRAKIAPRSPITSACKPTERMIGGGCQGADLVGFPKDYSETDTLGAAWVCEFSRGFVQGTGLKAFALCQGVSPAEPAAAP